jgi:hypothetical protein
MFDFDFFIWVVLSIFSITLRGFFFTFFNIQIIRFFRIYSRLSFELKLIFMTVLFFLLNKQLLFCLLHRFFRIMVRVLNQFFSWSAAFVYIFSYLFEGLSIVVLLLIQITFEEPDLSIFLFNDLWLVLNDILKRVNLNFKIFVGFTLLFCLLFQFPYRGLLFCDLSLKDLHGHQERFGQLIVSRRLLFIRFERQATFTH